MQRHFGLGSSSKAYLENHPEAAAQVRDEVKQAKAAEVKPFIKDLYAGAVLKAMQFGVREEVIAGIINEGDTALLLGKPKVGKSRFCDQVVVSLATGQDFLGMRVPKPRKVLYLDLENRPDTLQSRLNRMAGDLQWQSNAAFYCPQILSENLVDLSKPTGIKALRTMMEQVQPEFMVLDTWRLALGGNENETECVMPALTLLSSLKKNYSKLAILIVHHIRKTMRGWAPKLRVDPAAWVENSSGHYALIGHCDSAYGLDREQDEEGVERIVFAGVSRNFVPPVLLLEDCSDLSFRRLTGEAYVQGMLTGKERVIWTKAKEMENFTFQSIKSATEEQSKIIWSTLSKAQNLGVLDRYEGRYFVTVRSTEEDER